MFVSDEVLLDVSFAVARERLARFSESGALLGTSADAYGPGLARVGIAGVSKLVRVQVSELTWTDRSAGLALRWEATGAGGGLFPVLDADIKLAPAGDQGTLLTIAGAYRPPLGPLGVALDRAVLHLVGLPPPPSGVSPPGWRLRSLASPVPRRLLSLTRISALNNSPSIGVRHRPGLAASHPA